MAAGPTGNLARNAGQPDASKLRHVVFLSHASQDKALAEAVRSMLEAAGVCCWIAPRDVMAGRPYAGQLTEAVRTSQIALLILSRESNRSKHVLREIYQAAYFQIPILTFRVEEIKPSDDLAYFLLVDHWLNATPGSPESHFPELRTQILALLHHTQQPEDEVAPEPLPSQTFGNFRILHHPDGSLFRLGKGGMGVTWKAVDANLGRTVALKVVAANLLGSSQARTRFLREAQAAARINHPNVATVYQFGEEGDSYFYAMEFVEGEDLEKYVERCGPLTPNLALEVIFQVAKALEAARTQSLIHRDIKPANLMAIADQSQGLQIKLIDFGVAKATDSTSVDVTRLTRAQDFIGSPAFASPEQCEGGEMDTRSDIYSLGVVLWYLVSGRRPFTGGVGQLLIAHVVKPPPFDQLHELPEPVVELLKRMLAKRPDDRPQTPQELQVEVGRAKTRLTSDFREASEAPAAAPVPDSGLPSEPQPRQEPSDSLPAVSSPLFDSYFRFEIGALVNGRYRLTEEEQEGNGGRLFLVQDESAVPDQPLRLGLKLLHPGICGDQALVDLLENEVEVIRQSAHENLFQYQRLERGAASSFVLREWVDGFSLFQLLRWRGSCSATNLRSLLDSLAGTVDFVSAHGFGLVEVSLRKIFVVPPKDVHPESFASWARDNAQALKDCSLKLNPLSITPLLFRHHANRAQQTMVPRSQMLSLTQAQAGIQGTKGVRLFAWLIYELLSGHPLQQLRSESRYSPLPQLDEAGNAVLRRACSGANEPTAYKTCVELWSALYRELGDRLTAPPRQIAPIHQTASRPRPEKPPEQCRIVAVDQSKKPRPGKARWVLIASTVILVGVGVWLGISISSSPRLVPGPSPTASAPIAIVTPTAAPSISTTPTALPSVSPADEKYLVRAKAEAARGDYQTAIADFTEAIRLDPISAEGYEGRARAYIALKQYDKASADFTAAIRLKPDYPQAYEGRGRTHLASSKLNQETSTEENQKAVSDFTEAIRLKPDYAEAYEGRGRTKVPRDLDSNQKDREAASDFTEAIRLKPDYAEAYEGRGTINLTSEKSNESSEDDERSEAENEKAVSDFTEAIRLKRDYAEAYEGRGIGYIYLRNYDSAINDLTEVIRLRPGYLKAYGLRAASYTKKDQPDKAINDLTEIIQLDPKNLFAYYSRADEYKKLKEYQKAVSDYTEILRINPADREAISGVQEVKQLMQEANATPTPAPTPSNQESIPQLQESVQNFVYRHFQTFMNGNMSDMLDDYADTVDFYDVSSNASHEIIRRDRQKMFDRWVRRTYAIQKDTMYITVMSVSQPVTAQVQFSWQYSYLSNQGKAASGRSATQMRLTRWGDSWKIVSEKEAVFRNK